MFQRAMPCNICGEANSICKQLPDDLFCFQEALLVQYIGSELNSGAKMPAAHTIIGLPAIGILALIACSLWSRRKHGLVIWISMGLAVSVVCLLISSSVLKSEPPGAAAIIFSFLNAPNFVLFWLIVRALFEDDFTFGVAEGSISFSYLGLMMWERAAVFGWVSLPAPISVLIGLYSLGLLVHLVASLIRGRMNDLVEGRRRSRLMLIFLLIGAGFISVLATNTRGIVTPATSNLISVVSIAIASFSTALYLLTPDISRIGFPAPNSDRNRQASFSARDRQNHDKLIAHVEGDQAFLDPDLTIGKLAGSIGVAEHVLRALINQRLGFRNYADFINRHRIAYSKSQLADPERMHIPILTLALGSGFNSLSAFNRAFQQFENQTPSQYRKAVRHAVSS